LADRPARQRLQNCARESEGRRLILRAYSPGTGSIRTLAGMVGQITRRCARNEGNQATVQIRASGDGRNPRESGKRSRDHIVESVAASRVFFLGRPAAKVTSTIAFWATTSLERSLGGADGDPWHPDGTKMFNAAERHETDASRWRAGRWIAYWTDSGTVPPQTATA